MVWSLYLPLLLSGFAAGAQSDREFIWKSPTQVSGFPGLRAELQHLTNTSARRRINHFCVVVRQLKATPRARAEVLAFAYWPEEHLLQGLGPTRYRVLDDTAMAGAPSINLRDDVVDTTDQIGGSASRVVRSDVNQIIRQCRKAGVQMNILRKEARK